MNKCKTFFGIVLVFAMFLINISVVFAHAVVTPKEVNVGEFKTFSLGVPVEKAIATTNVKILIPDGMQYVTPTVKPGWTIAVKKDGEGESAKTTEINWSAGTIPGGQRDDFTFSAKAPAQAGELQWKVYQTYQDGTVVSWDRASDAEQVENTGPYSKTTVINDLAEAPAQDEDIQSAESNRPNGLTLLISVVAIALSLFALSKNRKS